MVKTPYVPDLGDVIYLDFDPQVGREQAKRRPALVLTGRKYNKAAGLAVVCPLTSVIKAYPFALRVHIKGRDGCVLTDYVKSMDWQVRRAEFYDRVPNLVLEQSKTLLGVLLGIH
jgi:mRNA interferase MazF